MILKQLVAEVFQEADGKWSFGRISSGVWLAACITWISFFFAYKRALPEGPVFFGMAAVVGTLYSANKIASALGGPPSS